MSKYNTPCFTVAVKDLQGNAMTLRRIASKFNVRLLFPVKAFPNEKLIHLVAPYVDGFHVSSAAEYSLVKSYSKEIWYYGNPPKGVKTDYVIQEKAKKGSNFVLRLNTESIHRRFPSRFGLTQISNAKPKGILVHLSFQKLGLSHYLTFLKSLKSYLKFNKLNPSIINLGGGLKELNLSEISTLFFETRKTLGNDLSIYFEPGQLWTWGILNLHTRILSEQNKVLVVDASTFAHLKWSLPFVASTGKIKYQIYGNSPHENDFICTARLNPQDIKQNKILVLNGVSSYSVAWNTEFAGVPKAKIEFY